MKKVRMYTSLKPHRPNILMFISSRHYTRNAFYTDDIDSPTPACIRHRVNKVNRKYLVSAGLSTSVFMQKQEVVHGTCSQKSSRRRRVLAKRGKVAIWQQHAK